MQRPTAKAVATAATLLVLLAGCGGNDDKKNSESGSDNGGESNSSPTPSTPTAPSFDPPKAFTVANAYPSAEYQGRSTLDKAQPSISGQVVLVGSYAGLAGHDVANPNNSWMVPSKTADTTTVNEAAPPIAVKVDGKDAALVAYAQTDKGNGTQKPKGLVVIQWIDVMTGKKIAEISTPVSTVEGQGTGNLGTPRLTNVAYDAETGQVAVGAVAEGSTTVKANDMAVFADPKTQKATIVPGIDPAAVHNGVIVGAKGQQADSATDGTMVLADGPSGKITKQVPLKLAYFTPLAGTAKYGYFYGMKYIDYGEGIKTESIYAVDLSSGAIVQATPGVQSEEIGGGGYTCFADHATSVVCTDGKELIGLDDTTGKKAWGFNDKSGGRIVPDLTAAFHGVVYAKTEAQPVLLDAKTGQDLPSAAPSGTPSPGGSPSSSDTPTSGDTPSSGDSPSVGDSSSPGNGDAGLTLFDGKQQSPTAVSPYGGVYRQERVGYDQMDIESIAIYLKPTA
ncbi:hypothetical protein [Kribbella sp. NPDC055071]